MTQEQTDDKRLVRVIQDAKSRTLQFEFRTSLRGKRLTNEHIVQIRAEAEEQLAALDLNEQDRRDVAAQLDACIGQMLQRGIAKTGALQMSSTIRQIAAQIEGLGRPLDGLARHSSDAHAILGIGHAGGMMAGAAALLGASADLLDSAVEDVPGEEASA